MGQQSANNALFRLRHLAHCANEAQAHAQGSRTCARAKKALAAARQRCATPCTTPP